MGITLLAFGLLALCTLHLDRTPRTNFKSGALSGYMVKLASSSAMVSRAVTNLEAAIDDRNLATSPTSPLIITAQRILWSNFYRCLKSSRCHPHVLSSG